MINTEISLEKLNATSKDTMIEHLGIEYLEMKEGYVKARMPVDKRTRQPYKILHGGATIALAETIASVGSAAIVDLDKFDVRGASVSANHLGAVSSGWVTGVAELIHKGKATHVWDVKITDEKNRNISVVRMTIMIIDKKNINFVKKEKL